MQLAVMLHRSSNSSSLLDKNRIGGWIYGYDRKQHELTNLQVCINNAPWVRRDPTQGSDFPSENSVLCDGTITYRTVRVDQLTLRSSRFGNVQERRRIP